MHAEPDQIINNITVQQAPPVPGQPQTYSVPPPNPAYGRKVGRNDPCPRDSGETFKKCHGEKGKTRYYGPQTLIKSPVPVHRWGKGKEEWAPVIVIF